MSTRKKKSAPKKIKSTNGCFIITILLTVLVVISLAATFYFLFLRPGPAVIAPAATKSGAEPPTAARPPAASPTPAKTTSLAEPETPATPPSPVESPATKTPEMAADAASTAEAPIEVAPEPPPAPTLTSPRIAIIIDDIGDNKKIAEQIIAIDLPLAFSVLPHSPHANHLASLAKARGRDLLLHLPMEANNPKWPHGPGTLLLSMSRDELISTINQNLDTPYRVIGINNHMGSKFSEDPVAMRILLNTIKPRGLFFIDSLTAINSMGFTLARDLGIKTAKRDIFLDNEQDKTKIMAQIGKLIDLAHRYGSAIGIGHPYPATLEALHASQTRLHEDITMVPVHELVF